MNRVEFLKSMGFKGASLMAVLTSCVNKEDTFVEALVVSTTPTTGTGSSTGTSTGTTTGTPVTGTITTDELNKITNVKLKIDLTASSVSSLTKVGGYVIQSKIVVARTGTNTFAAATQTCTHEPKNKVIYSQGEFYCTDHGARFSLAGAGLNSLGSRGLTTYKTATDGKTLVVY